MIVVSKTILRSFRVGKMQCSLINASYLSIQITRNASTTPLYNSEDQQKILNILNDSCGNLTRFKIPKNKIRTLEDWKNERGPFKNFEDIFEVSGIDVQLIEKLCTNIISNNEINSKYRRQLLIPMINSSQINNLTNVVGLHIGPTGISWVKLLTTQNKLCHWSHKDFNNLPKKLLPTDTLQLALEIVEEIPVGELYVFEASANIGPQSPKQAASVSSYTQHLELSSMLLALINTSSKHSNYSSLLKDKTSEAHFQNKVYYLRSKLPARLFKTLVGNEQVSANGIITEILESNSPVLPYTPVNVNQELKNKYYSQSAVFRELLGQALMLAITFLDVCIYKNPRSLSAIAPRRK